MSLEIQLVYFQPEIWMLNLNVLLIWTKIATFDINTAIKLEQINAISVWLWFSHNFP